MRDWDPLAVLLGSRSGRTDTGDRPVVAPIALVCTAAVTLLGGGTSRRFAATASSLGF
jgi:hypothetical protein